MYEQVKVLEQKIRDIFNQEKITQSDVKKANLYLEDWKTITKYKEDTKNPIQK